MRAKNINRDHFNIKREQEERQILIKILSRKLIECKEPHVVSI